MDFALTETQETLAGIARQIFSDHVTHERLKELESAGGAVFDRRLWQQVADAGILAAVIPEEYGGSGLGFIDLIGVLQEAGRAVAPIPLVCTLVLGALPLRAFGSLAQQERWLPDVADGSVILTAALEEPGNPLPGEPRTQATLTNAGWEITGEKIFVPYALEAARILIPAATDDGDVLVALVDPAARGVTATGVVATNHQPTGLVELQRVTVEAADVLQGSGSEVVRWITDRGAAALCAVQAGVCEQALQMTAAHTSERVQFGKPIAEFQAVAQRAADAYVDAEMVRLTALQAMFRLDQEWPAANEVRVAKFWAGDGGMRVVHAAQHLHGGLGVDTDYPLHRYFLWAKQIEHTLGTPTRELVKLGAALADEPV